MSDGDLIIKPRRSKIVGATMEVCRSATHKVNCANYGGMPYESRDMFSSKKATCAVEDEAEVAAMLYEACRQEVATDAAAYIAELRRRAALKEARSTV